MPTVDASKIKIRRGTNTERQSIVLDQGELGYTINTKRLYIGDGATSGGAAVGNINYNLGPRTSAAIASKAEVGDLIFDSNRLWSLSGTNPSNTDSWLLLSPRVDNTTIEYDSSGILQLIPGTVTLGVVGDGLNLDGSNIPYIYLDVDQATATFLTFNGGRLAVGKLTDESHGGLGYLDPDTATQHHTNSTPTEPGFMSAADKTKLNTAPTYPIASIGDANLIMTGVNNAGATKIQASRINGAVSASFASSANAVNRYTGESPMSSVALSGHELTTPYNFLNREDIPGTIFDTAIPTAYISNQGAFPNFKIGAIGTTLSTANYQDRSFLLPSADGTVYAIFIQTPGDDTALDAFIATYPEFSTMTCDYNGTLATLISNISFAILSLTSILNENLFDVWDDSLGNLYIQNLVRGYTPTYNATFAQTPNAATYGILDGAVTYANAATYQSKSGTGVSAGDSSSGTVPAALFGWVKINTTTQTMTTNGDYAIHTAATFPVPDPSLDGKYILIYDANYNRTCVWLDQTGTATQPAISNIPYHRGFQTNFVKVDLTDVGITTPDLLADKIMTTLQADPYFDSVYAVVYTSPTMTFTSNLVGYTDGIVNRVSVGWGAFITITPNATPGKPDVTSLNGAFFNAYKVTSPPSTFNQSLIVIPGKTQQTLIADDASAVNVTSLLKFR